MPWVEVEGTKVHYAERRGGPRAIVFLHGGFGSSSELWAGAMAALPPEWSAYALDNFLRSDPPPGGYNVAAFARRAARFADALGLDRPVFAGHSMGGRVALEVARRVPERLIGFAILDTGYEAVAAGEAGEREAAGRRSMLALARRSGMRAMARTWLQGMVHPPRLTDAELIEPIVDMFARRTPDLYAQQIQSARGKDR